MTRVFSVFSALALAAFLTGCPTDGGGDCASTVTEWTCENGDCTCDEDGASCTDPDDTTADDANNCDNLCEFCAD